LFYSDSDNRIKVVGYATKGDTFTAERPKEWSNASLYRIRNTFLWNLDLAPDGKRLVALAQTQSVGENKATVHVTFLLNFFDELRRRVPTGK
jgi:hypothetical protein